MHFRTIWTCLYMYACPSNMEMSFCMHYHELIYLQYQICMNLMQKTHTHEHICLDYAISTLPA